MTEIMWQMPGPEPGITIELRSVTPEFAKELLEANTRNRNILKSASRQYENDMGNDYWRFTGDPIQFDSDGVLLNGQHRLNAIISSGMSQPLIIVRGLRPEIQRVMDTGQKRSIAQALTIDREVNAGRLGALLRRIIVWQRTPGLGMDMRDASLITTSEIYRLMSDPDTDMGLIHESVEFGRSITSKGALYGPEEGDGGRKYSLIRPSVASFAYYIGSSIDTDAAGEFFGRMRTGERIQQDPLLALDKAIRNLKPYKRHGDTDEHQLALVFKAWNAFRVRKPMSVCAWRSGEKFPVPC
jgi:hypothetical protein